MSRKECAGRGRLRGTRFGGGLSTNIWSRMREGSWRREHSRFSFSVARRRSFSRPLTITCVRATKSILKNCVDVRRGGTYELFLPQAEENGGGVGEGDDVACL
jgi:hypothetical protein